MKDKLLIRWHDAKFCPGPYKKKDFPNLKMSLFESLGYLIFKDDATTIIAGEYSDDGEYRDITLIPTGSIKSIQKLVTSPSV